MLYRVERQIIEGAKSENATRDALLRLISLLEK